MTRCLAGCGLCCADSVCTELFLCPVCLSVCDDSALCPAAEEGAESSGGGADAPVIPGMGPEDRVEPPPGQGADKGAPDGEGAPGPPAGPDGDRRFPLRRPPWRFASHWNERWMQHEDPSAGEDRGQSGRSGRAHTASWLVARGHRARELYYVYWFFPCKRRCQNGEVQL